MKIIEFVHSFFQSLLKLKLFNDVERYVMFIGYPRSGHTLIGSLLDAHPNIIIANEQNVLTYLKYRFLRGQIFTLLLRNSQRSSRKGRLTSGYYYSVPEQYQGKFTKLKVIGDKKGGGSSLLLKYNISLLENLERVVRVPVKYIHVYRNPFDNITTWARGGNNRLKTITDKDLEEVIAKYFSTSNLILKLKNEMKKDIYDLKHENFVANPKNELRKLLEWLELSAPDDYLESCSKIVFHSPKKTRYAVNWPDHQVQKVLSEIEKYPWLKDYTFDN